MNDRLSVRVAPFLKINLLLFPIIIAGILFDYIEFLVLSYMCAILHELAHIYAAKKLGVGISYIEIQPFGVCARLKSAVIQNPMHEVVIALSGPALSFFLAVLGYFLRIIPEYFIQSNIALAAVNMLPVLPLDGGRVLRAALTLKIGAVRAYNATVKVSRLPIVLLILVAVYALLTAQFNFSLILIGVFLLGSLFGEQQNISRCAMRELKDYKTKLKAGEMNQTTVLCAHLSTPARKILRQLSYNRYHIVHVTDDDMKVVKSLTEGQLIDAIGTLGIRVTVGEI